MTTPTEGEDNLSRFEQAALALGRLANERKVSKRLQYTFIKLVSYAWVAPAVGPRVFTDGVREVAELQSDRGVVVAANHRSYFDAHVYMLTLYAAGARWPKRLYFPVRSNFFYERPIGVLVNFAIGAGTMYPPIFREADKQDHNRDAVERMAGYLQNPESLVGMHPEGTRNKTDDPYALLPAQPGVGQLVLKARPTVIPCFVNGISNNFVGTIRDSYRSECRQEDPVIVVFGDPVDYSAFTEKKPRAALYKRCADQILEAIRACGERERELRAQLRDGAIGDDHAGWFDNLVKERRARLKTNWL